MWSRSLHALAGSRVQWRSCLDPLNNSRLVQVSADDSQRPDRTSSGKREV